MTDNLGSMTATGTCPKCGTPLFGEAAAGLCPKCLGKLGFAAALAPGTTDSLGGALRLHRLGDYELIEEIARGGMGVVYKARQVGLNRIVAVKVVLHGPFSSPEFVERFRTEAAAVAGLQHPNIVAIYEVGQAGGDHFFSMEYIEGKNLAEVVREKPLPARRAAGYLKTIAEAVHYAHQRGVLHRDLKPSNVLLDVFDQPRITDFGLAKLINSDAELTTTGQVLGSPGHIPPEQAAGKFSEAGPPGDVYSLGAILYHLLTGRPPFQGETIQEILLEVQGAEPVPPRQLNPSVPVDLQTICLKCLQKEPSRRYASARELAEDLARFLANEPIRARPIGWTGRLTHWCRRKPALASSLGVGASLLLAVAIGSPIALVRIEHARQQEASMRLRAESAERNTQQQLYAALLDQARATTHSGEMGHRVHALDALRRAATISNTVELRREVFAALALPDLRFERELPCGAGFTMRSLDPSFERIAVCKGSRPVEIRSTSDLSLLATLPASTNRPAYNNAQWSDDGTFLAVKRDYDAAGYRASWEVWNVAGARRVLWLHDVPRTSFSFRPHSHRAMVAHEREVTVWDLDNGVEDTRFQLPAIPDRLVYSPKGERFVAVFEGDQVWKVSVHEATNGAVLMSQIFSRQVHVCAWHPDGRWLAVADAGGNVSAMDARTGQLRLFGRHKTDAVQPWFSPDGTYLISAGWDEELICWDAKAMRREFTISLNSFVMQFSVDGSRCAITTPSGVKLHAFERPSGHREFGEDLGAHLEHAAFSPDGRWLAASAEKQMGLWDLAANGPGVLLDNGYEATPCFSQDGGQLFASRCNARDTDAFRWEIASATNAGAPPQLKRLPLHKPPGLTFLTVHSNSVVITGSKGSQLLARDQIEAGPDGWLPTIAGLNAVSPEGRWLGIYEPFGGSLYIYRLPGLERAAMLPHPGSIAEFKFSPHEEEVAIASRAGVEFWSTRTWERTRAVTNFTRILYPPDANTLWLRKDLRTAGLYDRHTLAPLLLLPTDMIPLAVSLDGNHIAVSVDGRRLQVWDLAALHDQFRELGLDWTEAKFESR
jgi:WD40 repeat protein/predicted Ser/Thr protein kinase